MEGLEHRVLYILYPCLQTCVTIQQIVCCHLVVKPLSEETSDVFLWVLDCGFSVVINIGMLLWISFLGITRKQRGFPPTVVSGFPSAESYHSTWLWMCGLMSERLRH